MSTFYLVGAGGNTPISPYDTPAKAANSLKVIIDYSGFASGDIIECVYSANDITTTATYIQTSKSFTLRSYASNVSKPTIVHSDNSNSFIHIDGNNVHIENIKFKQLTSTASNPMLYFGGTNGAPTTGCSISGCEFTTTATTTTSTDFVAIKIGAGTDYTIINNYISGFNTGISSPVESHNFTIENNVFYNVSHGIDLRPSNLHVVIRNNIFVGNGTTGSNGIYIVEANSVIESGYAPSIIDYNDISPGTFTYSYIFVPTSGDSNHISSPGVNSYAIAADFISTTGTSAFLLNTTSPLTTGGYPAPITPIGLMYTYAQPTTALTVSAVHYLSGTIHYGETFFVGQLSGVSTNATSNYWYWTDSIGYNTTSGLVTSASLRAGSYNITLRSTSGTSYAEAHTSADIYPPPATSAVGIVYPTAYNYNLVTIQDSVINTNEFKSDIITDLKFNNNCVSFIEDEVDLANINIIYRDSQLGWTPPVASATPFRYGSSCYNSTGVDYIMQNKSLLKPFDGIEVPPNPGYGTSGYPVKEDNFYNGVVDSTYHGDLFGNNRLDYTA